MKSINPIGKSVVLAASTTTSYVNNPTPVCADVDVVNESTSWAWVSFGNANVAALAVFPTTGTNEPGFAVPPNDRVRAKVPPKTLYFAAILRTGTGNITFTPCAAE